MKRYKISQFSRRCGVSADTLRYYEKAGLLAPQHDPANQYRYYTDDDLVTLLHLRSLRGMDLPVSMLGAREEHRLEQFHASVSKQVSALEDEIKSLQRKLQRYQKIKGELEECRTLVGQVSPALFPEMYCVYLEDEDVSPDTQRIIGELSAHNAYSHLTFKLPARQLTEDAAVYDTIPGIGILADYARECKLQSTAQMAMIREGRGVRALLQIRDPLHPTREELQPVFDHLHQTQQTALGDWFYRLRFIERLPDGRQCCYVMLRIYTVPMEK